ncbi:SCO family protein [Methylobacterium segetis]|uniref:SCO family protein n=1 Tax=Methylobacterium segetis TaxID=2488750 RepID=UPI0014050468|nr:SCO family protein [Methylobacterium segetis]
MRENALRKTMLPLSALLAYAAFTAVSVAHEHHHPGEVISEREIMIPAVGYAGPDPHALGGHFELVDHTGRPVQDTTFRGRWMLIYFGYTGCREACPVALVTMQKALDALGAEADRIQPLFVDFSLEKPDFKGLAQFVSNFHPRLLGLTGTRAQTFAAARQFRVRREFMHGNDSLKETGPRIDHTTYFYLVDPGGLTRSYFYHDQPVERIIEAIRLHLPGGDE